MFFTSNVNILEITRDRILKQSSTYFATLFAICFFRCIFLTSTSFSDKVLQSTLNTAHLKGCGMRQYLNKTYLVVFLQSNNICCHVLQFLHGTSYILVSISILNCYMDRYYIWCPMKGFSILRSCASTCTYMCTCMKIIGFVIMCILNKILQCEHPYTSSCICACA